MSDLTTTVTQMNEVSLLCKQLLERADVFRESKSPLVRAMAYEIRISVSSMMASQKEVLNSIEKVKDEVGAMAG